MRIQHNITAMNSYRNFNTNSSSLAKNLEKLSSGYKINRAGDDAAGLAISEKMRAQITGLEGATKNAKDGISLIQTAEGALTEVHSMLNRMTTLAEQSANGTYQNELDREQLQKEVQALKDEIDRVADSTNFNGLKLLDGSLSDKFEAVTVKESALSAITQGAYAAKGKSDAITIDEESVVTRPSANTQQTNASFEVNLNAASFSGGDVGDKIKLNVGGTEIELTVAASGTTTAGSIAVDKLSSASDLATQFAKSGGVKGNATEYAKGAESTATNSTQSWATEFSTATNGNYIAIDGNYYKMTADGEKLKFEQVNRMDTGAATLNPAYGVSLSATDATGANDMTIKVAQQPNDQVQITSTGESIGASRQAEVDLKLDFSKLKDGDKLVAGDKTFVFKIGENSTTAAAAGENLVDLSDIFEETADISNADKQAEAMVAITKQMGDAASAAWTIGNGGVTGGVGKLSFQSLSTYADNAAKIGGGAADPSDKSLNVNMDTASNIVKQFEASSAEASATTSFNLDVTKIKVGDSFTVDGQTFEFTDGATASISGAKAIDLSSLGVSGGLLAGQKTDVIDAMKDAINDTLTRTAADGSKSAKYTISSSGNTVTLTSNDDTSTTSTFENRVSAKLELPTEVKNGEGLVLQIGDTADSYNKLTVSIEDMHASALGIGDLDISTQEGAAAALDKIKAAINSVSDTRGNMGALQNRLDHTINNLGVMRENIQSAESVIRDTDVAEEMMTYTKNNILNQSAQAMLAQANQLPQGVLQLLG